jgi:3-oxoacyl-(acyl-carrier-protein) synthase
LIEDEEKARARGAHIYGEISSIGYSFFPFRHNKYHKLGTGLKEAMRRALDEAELKPKDIDHISANANSTKEADCIETQAIKEVFGKESDRVPVSSVKSMVGETFSASGAMQLAAGLGSLEEGFIPPTINYEKREPCCDLDYVTEGARKAKVDHVLLSCFGPSGVNNCVVLSKYEDGR